MNRAQSPPTPGSLRLPVLRRLEIRTATRHLQEDNSLLRTVNTIRGLRRDTARRRRMEAAVQEGTDSKVRGREALVPPMRYSVNFD